MEVYTYSEARQNMAALLEKADQGERIRIRRKDGYLFELQAVKESVPRWMWRGLTWVFHPKKLWESFGKAEAAMVKRNDFK